MHLPANVPRSGGAATTREYVSPGAHTAAPGLIPGAGQLDKSDHRSTPSLRTHPPSHRAGRCHAEEYRPKETEVQELRRKRHAQEGGQGRSLSTMWRQRHQAVTVTNEPTEPSAQRGRAPASIRALRNLQNACADASKIHAPLPHTHCAALLRLLAN
jgi:hypothetical protein